MKKIAVLALLLAGVVGWAVRDEAKLRLFAPAPPAAPSAPSAPSAREQFAQKLRDNASQRARLEKQYPKVWKELAEKTRRDLATCVVTEIIPEVLKAECRQ